MKPQLVIQTKAPAALARKDVCRLKSIPATRLPTHPIQQLQRSIGNQAVQRQIQAKLVIKEPDDIYEQAADRMADQVISFASKPISQRKCACGCIAGLGGECAECRLKRLALQCPSAPQAEASVVLPVVNDVLRSPGHSLDAHTRAAMESSFGYDFHEVRVHHDSGAAESARLLKAHAYTIGGDIVFAAGRFAPGTMLGDRLLAHELTHVVQQTVERGSVPCLQRDDNEEDSNVPIDLEPQVVEGEADSNTQIELEPQVVEGEVDSEGRKNLERAAELQKECKANCWRIWGPSGTFVSRACGWIGNSLERAVCELGIQAYAAGKASECDTECSDEYQTLWRSDLYGD
jgi:hypothetical protein